MLYTIQEINISHLGKRKTIFKMPFLGDMLVPWRVTFIISWPSCQPAIICGPYRLHPFFSPPALALGFFGCLKNGPNESTVKWAKSMFLMFFPAAYWKKSGQPPGMCGINLPIIINWFAGFLPSTVTQEKLFTFLSTFGTWVCLKIKRPRL